MRAINQVDRFHSVMELAEAVQASAVNVGLDASIQSIPNPRVEAEEHSYEVDASTLLAFDLSIRPLTDEIQKILEALVRHQKRLEKYRPAVAPKTKW